MKLLIISSFFISLSSFSQDKLSGIGSFKINTTTIQNLTEYAKNLNKEIRESKNLEDFFASAHDGMEIIKVLPNIEEEYLSNPYAPKLAQQQVYYISSIKISDILIEDLYLMFFKDTLYKIETKCSIELADGLELKYGKPTIEKKEKNITCRSGMGVSYSEKEVTYTNKWPAQNSIQAKTYLIKMFDSKCKPMSSYDFVVEDNAKVKRIESLEKAEEQKKKKTDNEAKKSKLSGL